VWGTTVRSAGDHGFIGMTWPTEYGGRDLTDPQMAVFEEELSVLFDLVELAELREQSACALPNGSRLSCGRNAQWRKAAERQIKKLAGEAT